MFYVRTLLEIAGLNAILALSVYATMMIGQLSLAQVGFWAIGAYLCGILTTLYGVPLVPALVVTGLFCAALGIIIGYPCLRIRGIYLTLATVGFSEVVRVFLVNLEYQVTVDGIPMGPAGALGFRGIAVLTFWPHILAALLFFAALFAWLERSRIGLAASAIRDDETAALSMGLPVTGIKVGMFALGGFVAGVGGGLYATYTSYVIGYDFGFHLALSSILFVAVGGTGSLLGPIIGALLLTLIPEAVRFTGDLRMIVFGLLVLVVTILFPKGLLHTIAARMGGGSRWRRQPRPARLRRGRKEA